MVSSSQPKIPRLGVNIDHVATLRQARGTNYPSVVDAATTCFNHGADQITIHLREDRRHIQDTDVEAVRMVCQRFARPLNLEMGANREIVEIAMATSPDWICLVPEKREEQTTEGGLDLLDKKNFEHLARTIDLLKSSIRHLKISLFVESDLKILERATDLPIEAVEIHTGDYAEAFHNGEDYQVHLERFLAARNYVINNNVACHAGHGLTLESVGPLLESKLFEEYNIGHWIICQSVFDGLGKVTQNLLEEFRQRGALA